MIFIISLTGAVWCFSPEIESWTQSWQHVDAEEGPVLPMRQLQAIAEKHTDQKVNRIYLEGKDRSAKIELSKGDHYSTAFINQYNGKVLKVRSGENFFDWILDGHCFLWMGDVGGEIVRWATVIFVLMLISGIVLWWPKLRHRLLLH